MSIEFIHSNCPSDQRDGFTLVELLAIIAVVALLLALLVSIQGRTKVAMCASNLRQLAVAVHLYANENRDKLPLITKGSTRWVWDQPCPIGDRLLSYHLQKRDFYCPGTAPRFTDFQNFADPASAINPSRTLWTFGSPSFRIVGYVFALSGSANLLIASNQNTTVLAEPARSGPVILPMPLNSERVLVADATISSQAPAPGTTTYAQRLSYNYNNVLGAFYKPFLSPHLNGAIPHGGNVGFKDGHVAWRKFEDMDQRAARGPGFWW